MISAFGAKESFILRGTADSVVAEGGGDAVLVSLALIGR
jgi:hypothetical protein